MALILIEEKACENLTIDIDEYIPFIVEIESGLTPPLYWRGGDGELSLIEIGLNKNNGAVCSATLTKINPLNISETKNC